MRYLILFIIPVYLLSFEINFNKKFSKTLPQDTLSTYISIIVKDENEKEVNKVLSKFTKKIKTYNKVEKDNGSLNIRPEYHTSNNTIKLIGYKGELRYQVNSNKATYMDKFVRELIELKDNSNTNIVISNLQWKVKDKTYNNTYDILRLEAIKWIRSYAIKLSNNLSLKCNVENISINSSNFRPISRMVYSNADMSTSKIAVPESNKEEISINPSFIVECK